MKFATVLAILLLRIHHVCAKAAFAHFMVSNAQGYTLADWADDIIAAQAVNIDAFALNMAYDEGDEPEVALAFQSAASLGFKLFFSFDYAGNGPWPKSDVISLLNQYSGNSAYYYFSGRPFVSTFEGPKQAEDWIDIKAATNCFFVPDWSSEGAKAAMELASGVADGLFSWAAWPWGDQDMDTYVDASYEYFLDRKPFMMPVSPWFYTNLPGWTKNWLWRGDDLWFDRWQQVLYWQPEWVQIISWNDYGESHYIGPIKQNGMGLFTKGRAPFNYVTNMPHDGWRATLKTSIDLYVRNTTTFSKEVLSYWYRPQPAAACGDGLTTGNTASQLQLEFAPGQVAQDRVFYTAQLIGPADVSVSIGGVVSAGTWSDTPAGNAGLYHGSVPFNGRTGAVIVSVTRNGGVVVQSAGTPITNSCPNGLVNWNAWVGQDSNPQTGPVTATVSTSNTVCREGTGAYNFAGLCKFACSYGYCPKGACTCTKMGPQRDKPIAQNITAYPAAGLSEDYSGLCAFSCNLGYCPTGACSLTPQPIVTPTVSPFLPPACRSGTGSGNWEGLCNYSCNFGFCPRHICTCTSQGALNLPPPVINEWKGQPAGGVNDFGLCTFACSRGYCPDGACGAAGEPGAGRPITITPAIWSGPQATPIVTCSPPCNIILPPWTLPAPTTVTFPPFPYTVTQSWTSGPATTTVYTISCPPLTTTLIPVFNLDITAVSLTAATFTVTPSLFCSSTIIIPPPPGVNQPTATLVVTSTPPATTTFPPTVTVPKTVVSVTSGNQPGPTCTGNCNGQPGEECEENCSSCGLFGCGCGFLGLGIGCGDGSGGWTGWCVRNCWPWQCIANCGGGGRRGDGGGCVGSQCPPPPGSPPRDPNDEQCTSASTVTRCTVSCLATKPPNTNTMSTTCSTTTCRSTVGCDVTPTTTTVVSTTGCPSLPAYTPWWTDINQDMPSIGAPGWGGYVTTYIGTPTSSTPPPPSGPTPGPVNGVQAVHGIQWYASDSSHRFFRGWDTNWDRRFPNVCSGGDVWSQPTTAGARVTPDSLTGILVFGHLCNFSKATMKLTCEHWADASCADRQSDPNGVAGGGTCQVPTEYYPQIYCWWGSRP